MPCTIGTGCAGSSATAVSRSVESTTGAVAVDPGELLLTGRFRDVPVPHSGPWLRFQSPLVKPDVRIARIRLSPASSSLRARQVGAPSRQVVKAEFSIKVLVRVLAVPGAFPAAAAPQPAFQTPLGIPAHRLIDPDDRTLIEVRRPAADHGIERRHPTFRTVGMPLPRRRVMDFPEQSSNRLPGRLGAEIRLAVL